MKKYIIGLLLVILLTGCGTKKAEKLDYKCQKVAANDNYTLIEYVGYYSFKDGSASRLAYTEDYIPSNNEISLGLVNKTISDKQKKLNKYENSNFTKKTENKKIYTNYSIDLGEKNLELLKKDEMYKKYIKNNLFKADKYIEDLVMNGYICE